MNTSISDFPEQDWPLSRVCAFRRPSDTFGGFSNMSKSWPLNLFGQRIRSSEHLYQMMRFTHEPEIQELVRAARTPMQSKRVSREWTEMTRPDWDDIRVDVMRWTLRVKLSQHVKRFGDLLQSTGNRDIVEWSKHDSFWGAGPVSTDTVCGRNVLGRLLMELRTAVVQGSDNLHNVGIPAFSSPRINGVEIQRLVASTEPALLTADDVLEAGVPKCRLLGFVTNVCYHRQLNGEFRTRAEGLETARQLYQECRATYGS